ncbi:MAG: hypothetical protein QOI61_2640 [Actinomycetota bacterium]
MQKTIARRYAPLVAVVIVQLLIIALVPSTASRGDGTLNTTALGGFAPGTGDASGLPGDLAGDPLAGANGDTSATLPNGLPQTTTPGGVAGATGDTTHCVNGRTFNASISYYAPPCVPGTPGGAFSNNGGATAPGVSSNQITIVDYVSNYGAEVNAILAAQGTLVTYQDALVMDKAWENFLNKNYVLYGRKVKIITYQGQCQSVPPDKPCLLPEFDKVIDTYHPYIVYWNTSLCSECFAEIARKKVIGFGGNSFSDAFAVANQPYFYANQQSATRVESAFAEFWCNQMSSVNVPARRVKFAGTQNPAQNFNGRPRVLGVISTNDPDQESTVKNILYKQLKERCGEVVTHEYFYDQDINTAAKQVAAGIAAMNKPGDPATTVLCLCDSVAPAFLYNGEQSSNYYPENVIASNQGMDLDTTGQSYGDPNGDGSGSLGCPSPQVGCEFDLALGLSAYGAPEPETTGDGLRVFKAGGGTALPGSVTAISATIVAQDFLTIGNLLQNVGPNLTAANMQSRAPALGSVGGGATGKPLLSFAPGDWNYQQDNRIVYWSRNKKSPYNGKGGTFVQIEGDRYNLGQYPVLKDGPPVPPAAQR